MSDRLKYWIAQATIVMYLSVLSLGIVAHTVQFKQNSHPLMYFIVWDMFCGWSAYSSRVHLLAEGESGAHYELSPAPWGEFHPYASLDRSHYDVVGTAAPRLALNTLKHTVHEPIRQIYLIEENWAKKYNLPDHVWQQVFQEPKSPYSYFHIRALFDGEGNIQQANSTWLSISENPRLAAESQKGQPYFTIVSHPLARSQALSGTLPNSAGSESIPSSPDY